MATDDESPLIKALPPASDYLTYLTIVEYNLTQENLPVLHKVLQDETLTTNIGWDLVHLLVPHLPDSEQCLRDVARLGNPREVILKVTESLRLIDYDGLGDDAADDDTTDARARSDSNTYPLKTEKTQDAGGSSAQMVEVPPPLPLPVSQFMALLSMLAILHQRVKTKSPSRFLSTTLQAILASFSNSSSHREEMVEAIVDTVKAVTGNKRPTLPARSSSGVIPKAKAVQADSGPAADPEEEKDSDVTSSEESAMTKKLLQSFVTHILEEYLLNFSDYDDVPGMAWCSRIMEKAQPQRTIPESKTFASRFAQEERLHRRIDAVGQLVTLAKDLGISNQQLLDSAITVEKVADLGIDEDDPPTSAEDIPLSRLGSLLLYAARQASSILYDIEPATNRMFELFPNHEELLKTCLSAHGQGTGDLGREPGALIDSILALGIICLERDAIGEPATDEQFTEYLTVTALLSSNCPNANLRGHAHYLTSTVLRSQPDEQVRFNFIRDTLEHCPFENLKVSAVGWIKGETVEANPPTSTPGHEHDQQQTSESGNVSIFAKPLALDSLAPYLFSSLEVDLVAAPIQDAWMAFQSNVSFYLASLNFLFLLLQAKHIHQKLDILDLWTNNDIAGSFIQPLRDAKARFLEAAEPGSPLADEASGEMLAELSLLEETVERVTKAVASISTNA